MSEERTAREVIADALIPQHKFLLRAAYLLGRDEVLLEFLPNRESGESPPPTATACGGGDRQVLTLEQFRQR